MALAVKNGSLIRNGNDLSGGCGGSGSDCGDCEWADPVEKFEGNGASARSYTAKMQSPPYGQFGWYEWKPGYPEALDGTLWVWWREDTWAENDYETYGKRFTDYRLYQCQNGVAVDITSEAVDVLGSPPFFPRYTCVNEITGTNSNDWSCYDDADVDYAPWPPGSFFPDPLLICPPSDSGSVCCVTPYRLIGGNDSSTEQDFPNADEAISACEELAYPNPLSGCYAVPGFQGGWLWRQAVANGEPECIPGCEDCSPPIFDENTPLEGSYKECVAGKTCDDNPCRNSARRNPLP